MDSEGYFAAIEAGDLERLSATLAADPALLTARTTPPGAGEQMQASSGLHAAIHAGQVEAARVLIEAGIDLEAKTSGGRTALHDSIEFGVGPVTDLLLEHGAEVDVCVAAILGRLDRLRELLAGNAELANDRSTQLSPLGWAAFGNREDSAALLLEHGARMDDGELLCAASVGHVEVGRFLIDSGADPNQIVGEAGGNALHAAVAMRYAIDSRDFVVMLLDRGADINSRTQDGRTALEIAEQYGKRQAERAARPDEAGEAGEADAHPKVYEAMADLLRQHVG